jgi:hypothetical protein
MFYKYGILLVIGYFILMYKRKRENFQLCPINNASGFLEQLERCFPAEMCSRERTQDPITVLFFFFHKSIAALTGYPQKGSCIVFGHQLKERITIDHPYVETKHQGNTIFKPFK